MSFPKAKSERDLDRWFKRNFRCETCVFYERIGLLHRCANIGLRQTYGHEWEWIDDPSIACGEWWEPVGGYAVELREFELLYQQDHPEEFEDGADGENDSD